MALPGFIARNESLTVAPECTPPGLVSEVEYNRTSGLMTFSASAFVPEGAEVTLVFASALGIKLPLLGLARDDSRLTLSTNASFGPVVPTPISTSAGIGSFRGTPTLSFRGPAGAVASSDGVVEMTLRFTAYMAINNFETLTLYLPGTGVPRS